MDKQAKAKLIVEAAVSFLAKKHGVSETRIVMEAQWNEKVRRQIAELCGVGIKAAA